MINDLLYLLLYCQPRCFIGVLGIKHPVFPLYVIVLVIFCFVSIYVVFVIIIKICICFVLYFRYSFEDLFSKATPDP
jgi:hypothetical protein